MMFKENPVSATAFQSNEMTFDNDGLASLVLPVSVDGETWHTVKFEGGSARQVDNEAAAYVVAYRDRLEINLDENADWGRFPATFNALFMPALAPAYA